VPFRSALAAPAVVQVSVVLPPGATVVALARIPAATTVTVTVPSSVVPVALSAVMRYAVVVVGLTTREPFNATAVPFRFAVTALLVVQVSVVGCPDSTVVALARIPAATVPLVVPPEPMQAPMTVVPDWGRA